VLFNNLETVNIGKKNYKVSIFGQTENKQPRRSPGLDSLKRLYYLNMMRSVKRLLFASSNSTVYMHAAGLFFSMIFTILFPAAAMPECMYSTSPFYPGSFIL